MTAIATINPATGVDFDVPTRRRNFARMIRAASDPGVREFARLVHASRLLHKRLNKWLYAHDQATPSVTREKLTIATADADDSESASWRLVHNLNAIEWALESAVAQIDGYLFPHVLPEAYGRPFPAPEKRIAVAA